MKKETSAGIIIVNSGKYLLLNYPVTSRAPKEYWGLVKGHVEKGETNEEAAKREAKEETGLDIKIINGFEKKIVYYFYYNKEKIEKTVIFFVGDTDKSEVKLSKEHKGYVWLDFKDAIKQLSYENDRNVLKEAHRFHMENNLN